MYKGTLQIYNETEQLWKIELPRQEDDHGIGTWCCDHEMQLVDLHSLQMVETCVPGEQHPTRLPRAPTGLARCYVSIAPCYMFPTNEDIDSSSRSEPDDKEYHSFWVSLAHFGLEFLQKKINPLVLTVKGKGMDIQRLDR